MDKSRRALLRSLGGAALGGALAGCIGGGSGGDGATRTTPTTLNVSETGTAPPVAMLPERDYTSWLVAPKTMETEHYRFQSVAPKPLLALGSKIESTPLYKALDDPMEGVTMGEVERIHVLGQRLAGERAAPFCKVVKRGIDLSTVKAYLGSEMGLVRAGRYGAYFLYKHQNQTAAVKRDRLLLTESSMGLTFVRRIVDTSRREGMLYQEASEDCRLLVETLGTAADVVYGRTNEPGSVFDGGVAKGATWTATDGGLRFQAVVVFESESATDKTAVESWAGTESPVAGAGDLSVAASGRTVTATATVDPADVEAFAPMWTGESGGDGGRTTSDGETTTSGGGGTTEAGSGGDGTTATGSDGTTEAGNDGTTTAS